MKKIIASLLAVLFLFAGLSFATTSTSDAELFGKRRAKIKTSAICSMCKANIENALANKPGLYYYKLDTYTKILSVKYDDSIISLDQIKDLVNKAGYDADDMPADPTAYSKLAVCCKKGAKCGMD
jgi:mercuric ion binding protein